MDDCEPPDSDASVGSGDPEWDEYLRWREREIAAGRDEQPPEPWEIECPGVTLSLGSATDIDPAILLAIGGPDGLDGDAVGPQFRQGAAADLLRPGPVLAALTEQASDDLSRLTDNQLMGSLHADLRLENRAVYRQTLKIAEFGRRRLEEFETARARGARAGSRAGEFPAAELASELMISRVAAGQWIDTATNLTTRLPRTLQGMADGLIDAQRAAIIASYTGGLSAADAAKADEILAADAPDVRAETLARRAAALEMKLDPEAARQRKERTKRDAQRVEVRLERSGNASVAGRELDVADALASKAHVQATALRLRREGVAGTLDQLRVMVFNDFLQGRDPSDRLAPIPEAPPDEQLPPDDKAPHTSPTPDEPTDPDEPAADPLRQDAPIPEDPAFGENSQYPGDDCDGPYADTDEDAIAAIGQWDDPVDDPYRVLDHLDGGPPGTSDTSDSNGTSLGAPGGGAAVPDSTDAGVSGVPARAPVPAVINLLVHAGTLFGWDTTPSQANGWGLLDAFETRDIVRAASRHPQTRWCLTVIGRDGTAVAHGCSPGQHPWSAEAPLNPSQSAHGVPGTKPPPPPPPDASQAARFSDFLRGMNMVLEPIAHGTCDHRHAEDRYTPSRKLQHLIRARTATCTAPACQAQAIHADLDHTTPYPEGPTDECNLGPKCRGHHRAKQAPGWTVEQPEPGVFRWTLPSGRVHITRPTVY